MARVRKRLRAKVRLADAPVGLFLSDNGELCLKTEYGSPDSGIEAYIVSTGEAFCGGVDTIEERNNLKVVPVEVVPVVYAEWEPLGHTPAGSPLYRCSNCRSVVKGGGNFCKECGAKIVPNS